MGVETTPAELHSLIMPIMDRIVEPVIRQIEAGEARTATALATLGTKVDALGGVAHQVAAAEARHDHLEGSVEQQRLENQNRFEKLQSDLLTAHAEINKQAGRNQVIVWVLGLVGAPVTVALIIAGITKLFSIKMGM